MSEKTDMPDRWYFTKEICAYLGITQDTILAWITKKNMSAYKVGRNWMFKTSEIDEWVKSGKFAELLEHKSNKDSMAERKTAESALAAATARSQELLRRYERVYDDNVNGKVTDDWFMRLSHKYEVEQEELKKQMFDLKNKLERLNTAQSSSDSNGRISTSPPASSTSDGK